MQITEIIDVVNRMVADRVVEQYAIGGAVAATFYLEPVATADVDVFVNFAGQSLIIDPRPVFDYLASKGYAMSGEYVEIAGWPVQFLPPTGPLMEEALTAAVTFDVDGVPARVFTAEHLAAIALQTGRGKDKTRLLQFLESDSFNMQRFQSIVAQHGLSERWTTFAEQFLG